MHFAWPVNPPHQPRILASCRQQNALPQQINIGAAVPLAFEPLEPVDLPLNRTRTPRQRSPRFDRLFPF